MYYQPQKDEIPTELAYHIVASGKPLIAEMVKTISNTCIAVKLLADTHGLTAGDVVKINASSLYDGNQGLLNAKQGSCNTAKLRPGDIIAFDKSYYFQNKLYVEAVTARTNDMQEGTVQVLQAMARPSLIRSTPRDPLQTITLADGSLSITTEEKEEAEEFSRHILSLKDREGKPGLIVRTIEGQTLFEYHCDREHSLRDLNQKIAAQIDSGRPVELIPSWKLRVGREQIFKDVAGAPMDGSLTCGSTTSSFISPDDNKLGYRKCLIIVANGAPYSKATNGDFGERVAFGIQPIDTLAAVGKNQLPTVTRKDLGEASRIANMFDRATLQAMLEFRSSQKLRRVQARSSLKIRPCL